MTGSEIRDRLYRTEADDKREDGRFRREAELALREQRQDCTLQADHPADKRVDEDEQRELAPVAAQPQCEAGSGRFGALTII